jgi:hypothetical protein
VHFFTKLFTPIIPNCLKKNESVGIRNNEKNQ